MEDALSAESDIHEAILVTPISIQSIFVYNLNLYHGGVFVALDLSQDLRNLCHSSSLVSRAGQDGPCKLLAQQRVKIKKIILDLYTCLFITPFIDPFHRIL